MAVTEAVLLWSSTDDLNSVVVAILTMLNDEDVFQFQVIEMAKN